MENNENGIVQEVSTEVVVSDNTIVNSPTNDDNVSKKNRNFNTLVVVLFILLALGLSYGSYKAGIKKANEINEKEVIKNNTENKDDGVDKVACDDDVQDEVSNDASNEDETIVTKPIKNSKFTFVNEYVGSVVINDKDVEVISYYYLDSEVGCTALPSTCDEDEMIYVIRLDMYINNKLVIDSNRFSAYMSLNKSDADNFVLKAPSYETKKFYDSVTTDEYLLLNIEDYSKHFGITNFDNYYLINSNGETLKSFNYFKSDVAYLIGTYDMIGDRNFSKTNYDESLYVLYSDGEIDIHDDYIYGLSWINGECYGADEYRYTVENGKLVSKKTATYSEEYAFGAGEC